MLINSPKYCMTVSAENSYDWAHQVEEREACSFCCLGPWCLELTNLVTTGVEQFCEMPYVLCNCSSVLECLLLLFIFELTI